MLPVVHSEANAALADFYDAGLHDLGIESGGTIHALAEDPVSDRQFKITVHNLEGSKVDVTCMEVNARPIGENFDYSLTRYEDPIRPAELLTDDGLERWFWRQAISALLDVQVLAADSIEEASWAARYDEAERLNKKWAEPPAEPPPSPGVEEAFAAFRTACQRRAPYCQGLGLSWGPSLDNLPGVSYWVGPDEPGHVLYEADPSRSKQLYLNGFWTAEYCLEKDLLERYPDDPWARLGAKEAARDLLEIQRTGKELMAAQRIQTSGMLVLYQSAYRLRTLLGELGPASKPIDEDDLIRQDCTTLFHRISDYVGSLHVAGRPTGRPVAEDSH